MSTSDMSTEAVLRRPYRARALAVLAAVLAAGLIAAAVTTSFGQGYGDRPSDRHGMGPSLGPDAASFDVGRGFRHGGMFGGGTVDPARAEARADRMVRHLAVEVGANADQQEKLSTIAKGVVRDVLPVREKMMAARQQARDLLTAQTIDRAALEKLRAEQIAASDAASKRIVQALADAAEILTPEQRSRLNELIASHRRGWGFMRAFGHHMGSGWGGWGGWGSWR